MGLLIFKSVSPFLGTRACFRYYYTKKIIEYKKQERRYNYVQIHKKGITTMFRNICVYGGLFHTH